jgi:penicillin-binding protein 1A
MIRLIGYLFGIGTVLGLAAAVVAAIYVSDVTRDLPDYEVLAKYEPPVTTRIHASDGSLMAEYARQRRLYLPIQAVPDRVKAAFLSAEDKNFYSHSGIDVSGLARAVIVNLRNMGTGARPVGASTITQQVAKNFLLTSRQTISRKIREAVLAFRIEQAYSKDRILELYLNQIYLGLGSYGLASAALTYFDKSVNELTLEEAAYLAALPKGPGNYNPFTHTDRAIERRNWVIDQMVANGYVSDADAEIAKAKPLGVHIRKSGNYLFAADYFTEEVRRQLVDKYGQDALYEGGLSVRTTLNPTLQRFARKALQDGLIKYDQLRGFRDPVANINVSGDWGVPLGEVEALSDVPEWNLAVVLDANDDGLEIGLQPGHDEAGDLKSERETGSVSVENMQWAMRYNKDGKRLKADTPADVLSPGDVVYVHKNDNSEWELEQVPEISGGLVAMDPHTGRVLAMQGGFSFSESEFNRATQAYRQPGSSFKPFVYAAALDNGYTPASVVLDAPITFVSGGQVWEPKNYGGKWAGPSTLRLGIVKSRNLMTVRLANDMGMNLVSEYARRFGIYDNMPPLLAMALGSGETTVMRMVSAISVIANGGKQIQPSLIDRIQDRYGKTIFKHDQRFCEGCNTDEWHDQPEPDLIDNREQVLDPMTAYQITSMMEGVVQRGTGHIVSTLGRPIAGKTGTTNDEKDAWFIGFTPDLAVGVYMGYDKPRPMGHGATGGGLAAPVFKEFMGDALKDAPVVDFSVPRGMTLVKIDRKTGMRATPDDTDTIIEAFKPGTGPADSYTVIGMGDGAQNIPASELSPSASQAIVSGSGGLY